MKKTLSHFIFILCVTAFVAACGVKPSTLKAPEGSDPKLYPRSYPAQTVDK